MTYDECKALIDVFMDAASKLFDAKSVGIVRSEICVVRFVSSGDVYVRPTSDVSTPMYITPSSTAQLDDGDMQVCNISGVTLSAGDCVEVYYMKSIDSGVIVRKI